MLWRRSQCRKYAVNGPPPAQTPAMERKDDAPHLDGIVISKAPIGTSAASADAPLPAPNSPAEPALALAAPGPSDTEITELLEHGDALLRNGDVSSARLFYERAAGAGNGRAALRLGATFDPKHLVGFGLDSREVGVQHLHGLPSTQTC